MPGEGTFDRLHRDRHAAPPQGGADDDRSARRGWTLAHSPGSAN
jgi:hypothetical protein